MTESRAHRYRCVVVLIVATIGVCGLSPRSFAETIWPYRTVVIEPIPYYTDPQIDPELTQTPSLSYVRLSQEIFRMLDEDPRFEPIDSDSWSESALSENSQLALTFANDRLELGIAAFSRYEILTAIDYLEDAVEFFHEGDAASTHPRDLATAHEYLARAYLERANIDPEHRAPFTAEARSHFKEMIRLEPNAEIREGLFPEVVVDQFQQAYSELLQNDGEELSLSRRDLNALSRQYQAEVIVHAFAIRDAEGRRLVIEVHDVSNTTGVAPFRTVVPLTAELGSSLERVNRSFSRYQACIALRYEPLPPGNGGDARQFTLSAGWGAGVYGESPVDQRFLNQGVTLMVDYFVSNYLGVFGRANVMFSSSDPEGDLLNSFTSTRTAVGLTFAWRYRWFRAFFGTGLELNFVGSVSSTDEFWCKVNDGETGYFGVGQACLDTQVNNRDAVTLVGPYLMPGISFDIVKPFSMYLLGSFAFYVNSHTALDFPLGGELGLQYRF